MDSPTTYTRLRCTTRTFCAPGARQRTAHPAWAQRLARGRPCRAHRSTRERGCHRLPQGLRAAGGRAASRGRPRTARSFLLFTDGSADFRRSSCCVFRFFTSSSLSGRAARQSAAAHVPRLRRAAPPAPAPGAPERCSHTRRTGGAGSQHNILASGARAAWRPAPPRRGCRAQAELAPGRTPGHAALVYCIQVVYGAAVWAPRRRPLLGGLPADAVPAPQAHGVAAAAELHSLICLVQLVHAQRAAGLVVAI